VADFCFSEEALGDRVGFLFFTSMFWIMTTWFNALFACTSPLLATIVFIASCLHSLSIYYKTLTRISFCFVNHSSA
jgi:hypothetical protein